MSASSFSLLYQVLLYLNMFYFGMFATCEFCMKCVKAYNIPTTFGTLSMEFALLLFLITNEGIRIYLGRTGNLLDYGMTFLLSMLLNIPSMAATFYFFLWQNKVLRLEQILCGIQIVLLATEFIVGLLFLISAYRRPPPES